MKEKLKTISVVLILVLLLNIFAPAMKVIATDFGTGDFELTVEVGTDELRNGSVSSVKVNGDTWSSNTDTFKTATGNNTVVVVVNAEDGYEIGMRKAGDSTAVISEPVVEGSTYTFTVTYDTNNSIDNLSIYPYSQEKNNIPGGTAEDIDFDIEFTGTHYNVWVNNLEVMTDKFGDLLNQYKGTIQDAGTTDENSINILRFQNLFGDKQVTEYVINNKTYKEGMPEVTVDKDGGYHITVPGATKYTIRGSADENSKADRTIVWANVDANKNAEDYAEDMVLQHGSAKIVAIYDENGNKVNDGVDVDENGMAMVPVEPGSKVVFEFVPEYGYQLTSVKANGMQLEAQSTINQYTFTMPDANVHFSAEFKETKDIVKASSEKVSSGSIELGNTLSGGSAQLTVSDVELTSDKIAGFENAAGDYTISNYLDIDLYNVYYKGKNDSEDVWLDKISELEKEATISIKLEDGVNADDIVIVHNIHDGEKYEIIEIDSYDPETNTITFKTKSFSSYAIATKTTSNTKENVTASNPTTGDNIIILATIFAIATLGTIITIRLNKNRKIRKH